MDSAFLCSAALMAIKPPPLADANPHARLSKIFNIQLFIYIHIFICKHVVVFTLQLSLASAATLFSVSSSLSRS